MRTEVNSYIDSNTSQAARLFFRTCLESSPVIERSYGPSPSAKRAEGGQVQLHQLKRTMLQAALEKTSDVRLLKRLCGAANEAAELAWAARHPLQVFPGLFEELVQRVRAGCQPRSESGSVGAGMAPVCRAQDRRPAYLPVSLVETGSALRRSNACWTNSAGRA